MRRAVAIAVLVALIAGSVWMLGLLESGSDGLAGRAEGANVILVLVDALRADRLGAYGHAGGLTPRIDELARRSVLFTDAHANAPSTVRSVASLFTSTLPVVHRVSAPPGGGDEMHLSSLPQKMVLAPEVFARAGYSTIMVTGRGWITPEVNYDQGVDEYVLLEDRSDQNLIDAATEALRQRAGGPVFLYLHLLDLHDYYHSRVLFERNADLGARGSSRLKALRGARPGEIYRALYSEPESFTETDVRLLSEAYDRELARTDRQIGRLIDALSEIAGLGRTLLVLTSDHGEQFGEHGLLGHGGDGFYEEVLHIPFIVAGGPLRQGHIVGTPTSSIDIIPTVADLVGLEPAPEWQGVSRLPESGSEQRDEVVVATNRRTWKLITQDWSFIYSARYGREELYERSDGAERRDMAGQRPEVGNRFRDLLGEVINAARDHPYRTLEGSEVEASEEVIEALRSLGYIR